MQRNSLTLLISWVFFLVLCTEAPAVSALPANAPEPPATPVALDADINNLVFTGMVKRLDHGTALVTENATYLLAGGNFEGIVGREVNIIGKVIKEGTMEKIHVARAQLAGP